VPELSIVIISIWMIWEGEQHSFFQNNRKTLLQFLLNQGPRGGAGSLISIAHTTLALFQHGGSPLTYLF
jgi:hypothetical protein